jgi:3-oxoacyl-[acyl-carrier-protein] synthase-3
MSHSSRTAVLTGIGACVPPLTVTNDMLAERLDTTDEWIRTRTGIVQRHMVEPGLATSDLAVEAGRQALKSAGLDGVGAVVLATATPDRPCPATAPEVASRLGMVDVPAFDVGAVCTGFIYGLATGAGLIAAGLVDELLVIAADTFSTILDPTDRTTAVIFGDGAGAVVLRAGDPDEPGALRGFDLGSDGGQAELIMVPGGGSRQRAGGVPPSVTDSYFTMQGKPVFMQAVVRMTASCRTTLQRAGWAAGDVDALVAHQANSRIVQALAERLGVAAERAVVNIDRVGNTAAASIPLALADAARCGAVRTGQRVLLTAFGGGLTWGSVALDWPDITVL